MYKQSVKIRHEGRTEIINLEYERDESPNSTADFTTDSDSASSDFRGESDEGFVLTLSEAYDKSSEKKCAL